MQVLVFDDLQDKVQVFVKQILLGIVDPDSVFICDRTAVAMTRYELNAQESSLPIPQVDDLVLLLERTQLKERLERNAGRSHLGRRVQVLEERVIVLQVEKQIGHSFNYLTTSDRRIHHSP